MKIEVVVAQEEHLPFAQEIVDIIAAAAKARGTGIAKREPSYIEQKIREGKAVIALADGNLAGFCYIETWEHQRYVANSGLIVAPDYRKLGLARKIKAKAFELSRKKYPEAKIFGITTSLAVMKINSELGYRPVTFSELTQDEVFWNGCKSCPNYDILTRNQRKICLCTGMMADPQHSSNATLGSDQEEQEKLLKSRWERYKEHLRKRNSNKVLQRILQNLRGGNSGKIASEASNEKASLVPKSLKFLSKRPLTIK